MQNSSDFKNRTQCFDHEGMSPETFLCLNLILHVAVCKKTGGRLWYCGVPNLSITPQSVGLYTKSSTDLILPWVVAQCASVSPRCAGDTEEAN